LNTTNFVHLVSDLTVSNLKMSVVVETTLGDITVDLYTKRRPRACHNFLKLCKIKYYNYNLFHTVSRGFIAQTGDPTGSRTGGESIFGVLDGPLKRYFEPETNPRIKHTTMGQISFVGNENSMIGSQFFFTLGADLTYLDERHCVFGEVVEGLDVLEIMNEAICDNDDRPYQDIRITHTVILDDPFPDDNKLRIPSRSPSPSAERLQGGRIAPDEEIDETAGKTVGEVSEMIAEREARARATILEMVGDIPDADMAPPENVLFVCKLNPVTSDDDLEIIFSRFGKIKSCEVIRDRKTGDSLQYAFVEFEEQKACEDAYFKMDNVLIDDRRIHVDFSQSVSKVKWLGKGRGVRNYGEKEQNLGKGQYQKNKEKKYESRDVKNTERRTDSRRQEKSRDGPRGRECPKRNEDRSERRRPSFEHRKRDRSRSSQRHKSEKYERKYENVQKQEEKKKKRDELGTSKTHKEKLKRKGKKAESNSSDSDHKRRHKKKSNKKKKYNSNSYSS
jgi:peptidyl-prolyl cis-trans isomerase-like 4